MVEECMAFDTKYGIKERKRKKFVYMVGFLKVKLDDDDEIVISVCVCVCIEDWLHFCCKDQHLAPGGHSIHSHIW